MQNYNQLICGALSWKILGETFWQFCDYVIKNFRRLYKILSTSLSREIIPANLELSPGSIRSRPQPKIIQVQTGSLSPLCMSDNPCTILYQLLKFSLVMSMLKMRTVNLRTICQT